ncbi:MAG: glycosyltransferase family 2 protein [Candidatus Omnitrophica bacterium]|nr:glycosyltransferase family 2 protein [Candidatus Omnitrophota bacterium]
MNNKDTTILVSVVMPAYNEIHTIRHIISKVMAVKLKKELIIVDDASTDGTREYLRSISDKHITVVFHEHNRGKGAAIRTALQYVKGDITLIQDADLEYDPEEYGQLIELILKDKADVVYGSRFLSRTRVFYFYHLLGNKIINLFANILFNTTFTDLETCYKAFKTKTIQDIPLHSNSFGFEAEITAKLVKRKLRIFEVPISYYGRTYEEGKKITWKDGIIALYWLVRCRFSKN